MHEDNLNDELIDPPTAYRMAGGMSASTIRRRVLAGEFPAPIVLGRTKSGHPSRVAFVRSEVVAWVRQQIAKGDRALVGRRPGREAA